MTESHGKNSSEHQAIDGSASINAAAQNQPKETLPGAPKQSGTDEAAAENGKKADAAQTDQQATDKGIGDSTAGHTTVSDGVRQLRRSDSYKGRRVADRWSLDERIGKGGMSVVYKAHHVQLGKTVAVKLLLPHLVEEMKSQQRFAREAKAASSLSHPNVMTVHDYGMTDEGEAYIIMDYLEGKSVADILQQKHHIAPEEACEIFYQTALGLQHAHSRGVVHRDLKPSNLMMVNAEGTALVKIVDFGIAKVMLDYETGGQNLTKTGEVFGSPYYMSPEQCKGKVTDARADIYSMGCLMYEALCGTPPFIGENSLDTMFQHLNEEPNWLMRHSAPDSLIKRLDEIVQKCLEKDPSDRYQTAEELAADLKRAATISTSGWYSHSLAARTARTLKVRGGWKWRILQAAKIAAVIFLIGVVTGTACLWAYVNINKPFDRRKYYQFERLSTKLVPPPPVSEQERSELHLISEDALTAVERSMQEPTFESRIASLHSSYKTFEKLSEWEKAAVAAETAANLMRQKNVAPSNFEAYDRCRAGKWYYFAAQTGNPINRLSTDAKARRSLIESYEIIDKSLIALVHNGSGARGVADLPSAHLLVEPLTYLEQVFEDENNSPQALIALRQLLSLNGAFPTVDDQEMIGFRYADLLRRSALLAQTPADLVKPSSEIYNRTLLDRSAHAFESTVGLAEKAQSQDPVILAKEHYGHALCCWGLYTRGDPKTTQSLQTASIAIGKAISSEHQVVAPDYTLLGSMQMDYSDILWAEGDWLHSLLQRYEAAQTFEKLK